MTYYNTEITQDDAGIVVTITGDFGYVEGWELAREDLGLNKGGPDIVDGISLIDQMTEYYENSDNVKHYSKVVLRFDNEKALEYASDRLYSKATERFEWGMGSDAEKVQVFAGVIPTPHEVEQEQ